MTYGAFGLVEVLGEANAVLVLDRMLKTAEVFYETQDTKCGGHALIFCKRKRISCYSGSGECKSWHHRVKYFRRR